LFIGFWVLLAHLTGAANLIFVGGKLLKCHRTAGMKLVGADSDLRAESELAAVGKTRRSVPINGGGIDLV